MAEYLLLALLNEATFRALEAGRLSYDRDIPGEWELDGGNVTVQGLSMHDVICELERGQVDAWHRGGSRLYFSY